MSRRTQASGSGEAYNPALKAESPDTSHAQVKEADKCCLVLSRREQARQANRTGTEQDWRRVPSTRVGGPTVPPPERFGCPCARGMIPLESPVPEIGTPGSESGDWKRRHGSRTEARRESVGTTTGP